MNQILRHGLGSALILLALAATGCRGGTSSGSNPNSAAATLSQGPAPALIQAALDRARRDAKLVLVDFSAEWCAPCKRMLQETYRDPRVSVVLEGFVFLKVDTAEHPEVAKHFGVVGIPDARILDPDGRELAHFVGFKPAEDVLAILQQAVDRSDRAVPR